MEEEKTLAEIAGEVLAASKEIDEAIVSKGGATEGGLKNAAAAIAALPSGGPTTVKYDAETGGIYVEQDYVEV